MNTKHFQAVNIYSVANMARSMFEYYATTRSVNYIQQYRGRKLYDVDDWNKKVPEKYQVDVSDLVIDS